MIQEENIVRFRVLSFRGSALKASPMHTSLCYYMSVFNLEAIPAGCNHNARGNPPDPAPVLERASFSILIVVLF